MKKLSVSGFILLCFVCINSCIEEYLPRIDQYDNILVIDGKITDKPGPYTVRISRSTEVNNPDFKPVSDCEVVIYDNDGNTELMGLADEGIYQSAAEGIQGRIGKKYRIEVKLPNGNIYKSDFEELKNPIELDTVYAQIEYRDNIDFYHQLAGYQFYLNTKLAPSDSTYFLWDLEATYHYQSDYTIRWIYEGTLEWSYAPDTLFNCWSTYKVNEIFAMSTNGLNPTVITAFPLYYVNTQTRRLSVRYSLLIKQYTISQDAFVFYNGLKDNNGEGSLYDQQPVQIRGNVYNIYDPEEPVLGYFLVAGEDEKRIFVDRPKSPVPFYYPVCTLSEADFEAYGQLWWMPESDYPIFAIETPGGRRAVPHKDCVDCRQHGGTIFKPLFWID